MEGHGVDCKTSSFSNNKLDDADTEKMHDALTAIVQEIERLTTFSYYWYYDIS